MARNQPVITDSGGFQAFSLATTDVVEELKGKRKKVEESLLIKESEEGLVFRSYKDGRHVHLSPESAVRYQKGLGADIILPLDYLLPHALKPLEGEEPQRAVERQNNQFLASFERTHRWQIRSFQEHQKDVRNQAMYAIIHGGTDEKLRAKSVELLAPYAFNGYAIGGSLGASRSEIRPLVQKLLPSLNPDMPVHLLGIGDLESIDSVRDLPIDTYDSAYPTILARHGKVLRDGSTYKIEQESNRLCFEPLDPACTCAVCARYTRAYLHHLKKANETTSGHLLTIHNLHYMVEYFRRLRTEILESVT